MNEFIRRSAHVLGKRKARLRWFEPVQRTGKGTQERKCGRLSLQRKEGRRKRRCMDAVEKNTVAARVKDAGDRATW